MEQGFGRHPDAEIYLSQPGLGTSSAPGCWPSSATTPTATPTRRARKNYAGMSPDHQSLRHQTGRAGPLRPQPAPRRRAVPAGLLAHSAASPGARAYYDRHRARGATHNQALRALANRLVGILHGCLRHPTPYDETPRLAHRTRQTQPCSLTSSGRGMSSHSHFRAPGRNRTYDRQIRRLLLYPLSYGGRSAPSVRPARGSL